MQLINLFFLMHNRKGRKHELDIYKKSGIAYRSWMVYFHSLTGE